MSITNAYPKAKQFTRMAERLWKRSPHKTCENEPQQNRISKKNGCSKKGQPSEEWESGGKRQKRKTRQISSVYIYKWRNAHSIGASDIYIYILLVSTVQYSTCIAFYLLFYGFSPPSKLFECITVNAMEFTGHKQSRFFIGLIERCGDIKRERHWSGPFGAWCV